MYAPFHGIKTNGSLNHRASTCLRTVECRVASPFSLDYDAPSVPQRHASLRPLPAFSSATEFNQPYDEEANADEAEEDSLKEIDWRPLSEATQSPPAVANERMIDLLREFIDDEDLLWRITEDLVCSSDTSSIKREVMQLIEEQHSLKSQLTSIWIPSSAAGTKSDSRLMETLERRAERVKICKPEMSHMEGQLSQNKAIDALLDCAASEWLMLKQAVKSQQTTPAKTDQAVDLNKSAPCIPHNLQENGHEKRISTTTATLADVVRLQLSEIKKLTDKAETSRASHALIRKIFRSMFSLNSDVFKFKQHMDHERALLELLEAEYRRVKKQINENEAATGPNHKSNTFKGPHSDLRTQVLHLEDRLEQQRSLLEDLEYRFLEEQMRYAEESDVLNEQLRNLECVSDNSHERKKVEEIQVETSGSPRSQLVLREFDRDAAGLSSNANCEARLHSTGTDPGESHPDGCDKINRNTTNAKTTISLTGTHKQEAANDNSPNACVDSGCAESNSSSSIAKTIDSVTSSVRELGLTSSDLCGGVSAEPVQKRVFNEPLCVQPTKKPALSQPPFRPCPNRNSANSRPVGQDYVNYSTFSSQALKLEPNFTRDNKYSSSFDCLSPEYDGQQHTADSPDYYDLTAVCCSPEPCSVDERKPNNGLSYHCVKPSISHVEHHSINAVKSFGAVRQVPQLNGGQAKTSPNQSHEYINDIADPGKVSTIRRSPEVLKRTASARQVSVLRASMGRPLTRYLPVPDDVDFDLVRHLDSVCHHDLQRPEIRSEITVESTRCFGYLFKMNRVLADYIDADTQKVNRTLNRTQSTGRQDSASPMLQRIRRGGPLAFFRRQWRRRWLLLDRKRRLLTYHSSALTSQSHATTARPRGIISFADIVDVYPDHLNKSADQGGPASFCVMLLPEALNGAREERLVSLWLRAPTHELMRIWVDALFTCAGAYLMLKNPAPLKSTDASIRESELEATEQV